MGGQLKNWPGFQIVQYKSNPLDDFPQTQYPQIRGAGLPMPEFFGPLFRSAFLVNKKSLFLQKCQSIEL